MKCRGQLIHASAVQDGAGSWMVVADGRNIVQKGLTWKDAKALARKVSKWPRPSDKLVRAVEDSGVTLVDSEEMEKRRKIWPACILDALK